MGVEICGTVYPNVNQMMVDSAEQFASNDYSGVCPEALESMIKANYGSAPAYGNDE